MLDVKEMKNVDNISPFIGAVIERECGESEDAPLKLVFKMYIDLMAKYVDMKSAYNGTGGAFLIWKNRLRYSNRKQWRYVGKYGVPKWAL